MFVLRPFILYLEVGSALRRGGGGGGSFCVGIFVAEKSRIAPRRPAYPLPGQEGEQFKDQQMVRQALKG
jgi:hypothetical protein